MKILMLSDFYPPFSGGQERAVADLSAELSARGHEVHVATLWHEGLPRQERDGLVMVHRFQGATQRLPFLFSQAQQRFHPPVADPILAAQLRRLIATEHPDVVHGHTWMMLSAMPLRHGQHHAAVVTLHDYALLCPKKTLLYQEEHACPYTLSRHCLSCAPRTYGKAKGWVTSGGLFLGRRAYRAVDAFMAVSSYVAAAHTREGNVAEERITTVPNFVRDSFARAPRALKLPGWPDEYILYLGALTRAKGFHVLLDAYARLEVALPLVAVGRVCPDTPARVPPGVVLHQPLAHEDVVRAIDHCRFLVSPGLWPEPFGLVAIEAMARGKAVVASRAGGTLDIVRDGENGLLAAPGDRAELARTMRRLSDDPALAERLGEAGMAQSTSYTADAVIPRVLDVYQAARQHHAITVSRCSA